VHPPTNLLSVLPAVHAETAEAAHGTRSRIHPRIPFRSRSVPFRHAPHDVEDVGPAESATVGVPAGVAEKDVGDGAHASLGPLGEGIAVEGVAADAVAVEISTEP
jgi:hypothetical protein